MKDALFGALAVRAHFVLEHQVQEALEYQRQLADSGQVVPRLGEILAHRGYMTPEQVQAVLKGQIDQSSQRFGEIAVALHFCNQAAVEAGLQVQQQIRACGSNQRLGEILVARGSLRPHQVHSVLSAQGKSVVQCPHCKASMNVRGLAAGVSVNCPKCRSIFQPVALQQDPVIPVAPPVDVSSEKYVGVEMSAVMPAVNYPKPPSGSTMNSATAIGPYQLTGKLGSDSSGVLYKATEPRSNRALVIRLLSPAIAGNKEAIERWTASGQAASELSHPNLQRILSIEGEGGRAYIVMEYVEGESLRKLLSKGGKYSPVETVDVLIQAAEALNYGHANGFLHGDLRPNHILMGTDGIVRVSGLGTPKSVTQNLRQVAAQLGDEALPLYTPPELILDEEQADERSDVYSLGAIGYHMMTGRPPHEGTNVLQVGLKIAAEDLIQPARLNSVVPAYLNRLVCKCLEAEPDDRYDTIAELLEDLRKCRHALSAGLTDVQEIAPVPTHTQRFRAVTARRSTPRRRVRTYVSRRPGASTGKFPAVGNKSRVRSAVQPAVGSKTGKFGAVGMPRQSGVTAAVPPANAPHADTTHIAAASVLAHTPPPEDNPEAADAELEAELAQLQQRKQRKMGEKLDSGVNTTYVLAGVGAIVLMVGGLIFYSMTREPRQNVVNVAPEPTNTKVSDEPPKVVVAGDPAAAREWRLIQEYIAGNGTDTAGIVKRLDTFRIKFVDIATPGPQAAEAKDQLKQYSTQGAAAALADLKADIQKKAGSDQFGDAVKAVDRWEEQWHAGADTASTAKALREDLAKTQKQTVEKLMAEALSLRKARKFNDANAIYKRIAGAYDTAYASEARKAMLDSASDAESARAELDKQAQADRELKEKLERENAAPARLKGLEGEIEQALKIFDIERAKKSLDDAGPHLLPTQSAPDFTALKTDVQRLEGLRTRMSQAIKTYNPKVSVKGAQYTAVEASSAALVLETNGAKMNLPWTDVSADDLGDIAKRATNEKSGNELLEYAMLRYHLGAYREARNALEDAQKLGAVVSRYAPRIEARIKDIASKPVEAPKVVAPPPEPVAVKLPAGMDKETYDALKAKGLEHQRGVWQIAGDGTLRCYNDPDPSNKSPTLMSLRRPIAKNFRKISMEVRGGGDEAGFSFGTGRRLVVKPSTAWQTITVERDKEIVLKVDGKVAKSNDELAADVKPDNLAADGIVFIRFVGNLGEIRNLVVEE